jgi:hypothetical protein
MQHFAIDFHRIKWTAAGKNGATLQETQAPLIRTVEQTQQLPVRF